MQIRHSAILAMMLAATNADAAAVIADAPGCAPGMSFWSLLGSIGIGYADGLLRMEKLYAVCLPESAEPGNSSHAYSPEQGGKLRTLLKTADGQVLTTYVWYAENVSGLWELSDYKVLGGHEAVKPLGAGHYTLEFEVDGRTFARFPVSVVTKPSDDPYQAPGTRYFIEGPWNEYGNIFYQRNDPESSLRFTTWVQDESAHPQQKSMAYTAQLLHGGRVIGEDKGTLRADQQWRQLDIHFATAQGAASDQLKAGAVLREDGAYRVQFGIDGKPYGDYAFDVADGRIQMQGLQRERGDPTMRIVDYLYGGRYPSYWIKREHGGAKIAD